MNLRRVRIQLTALFAVMAAIVVAGITWFSINQGSDRIYEAAEREAEQQLKDLALAQLTGEPPDKDNTWRVIITEDWDNAEPLGDTWVEPPLYSLVERAGNWPRFQRFSQDGEWLAYTEPVKEQEWVVTAVALGEFNEDASTLRWRLSVAALGSIAAMAVLGYWLAGRSLRPARLAMSQQRDFIADAAHELRTPLAVIQASAGHTLSRPRSDEEYRNALDEILTATTRAGASVSELLELARLDAGQAQPRRAPLRADLLIEEVAASIRVDNTSVSAEVDEAIVIDADYALLRQVLDTLTRNSAARARDVVLSARVEGAMAELHVRDNGPGFDEEVLPHVFDRFRRGDSYGSSGLGMAIAKKIVEAHDGAIAASNGPDGGAVVSLSLPLGEPD